MISSKRKIPLLGTGSSCLPGSHLSGQREGVGEEKFSEARELGYLFHAQLVVIVRAMIAIEPDQMGPLLQIIGQSSRLMEGVDPRGKVLSSESCVQLSGRDIKGFSVHSRCRVHVLALRIVDPLLICAANDRRRMFRRICSLWSRIDTNDSSVVSFHRVFQWTRFMGKPIDRYSASLHADTENVVATVALKHRRWSLSRQLRVSSKRHSYCFSQTVGAVSNIGNSHV